MAFNLKGSAKEELVVSLAALVCADSKIDISAENLTSVITAANCNVASYWAPLFATYIEKAGGVSNFLSGPGSGGGGGGSGNYQILFLKHYNSSI